MRSVHIGDFRYIDRTWLQELACTDTLCDEFAALVELGTSIGDDFGDFLAGVEVNDFVRNLTVLYLEVWRFDETVLIDTSIAREVEYETNVRTFWCFDATDTTIVGWMGVTDIKSSALTRETTRTHRAESAFVRKFRDWVHFVEEL